MTTNKSVSAKASSISLKRRSGALPFKISGRTQHNRYSFESISLLSNDGGFAAVHSITTESPRNLTDQCSSVILKALHLGPSAAISTANNACKSCLHTMIQQDACISALAVKSSPQGICIASVGSLLCYTITDSKLQTLAFPQITSSGMLFNYLNSPHYQPVSEKNLIWPDNNTSIRFVIANRDVSISISPEEINSLLINSKHQQFAIKEIKQLCRRRNPNCTPLLTISEMQPTFI